MAGFLETQTAPNQVEAIYIAYFGRASDGPGYNFWTQQFANAITAGQSSAIAANNIANSFAPQPEAKAQYGFLASPPAQPNLNDPVQVAGVNAMIETVYQNLFNRAADIPGLNYWTTQILTQQVAIGTAIYAIANGSLGNDQTILQDKIISANNFTAVTFGANLGTTSPLPTTFLTAAKNAVAPVVDQTTLQAAEAASAAYAAGTTAGQNISLTTSQFDNVVGTNIFGSLTPFGTNGVGPTVQSTDIVTGTTPPAGQTANNTFTVTDDFATANDALPTGITIKNIQNIVLNTAAVAGGAGLFDTTPFPSVVNTTINSQGLGVDNVRVSLTTALTVNHQNVSAGNGAPIGFGANGVQTFGGSTVTVNDNAGVGSVTTVGSTTVANANPTGAVTVTAVSSTTQVFGGTTVTVNQSGIGGGITIGTAGFSVSPAEPTGAVTVNAPATSSTQAGNAVTILGGASDTVTTGGGLVTIGAQVGQTVFSVTGNSTITDNAAVALTSNYVTGALTGVAPAPLVVATPVPNAALAAGLSEIAVTVLGGQAVTATTNAGGVVVGATSANAYNGTVLTPGLLPSGDVTITDTSDLSPTLLAKAAVNPFGVGVGVSTPVSVYGGANVTVTDSGSAVTVGDYNAATNSNVVAPTGAVVITDTAQVVHDGIVNADDNWASVFGGTDVTITTNAGDAQVGTLAGVAGTEPTGNITVTDTAWDAVLTYGGKNVTISATNGAVTVGAPAGVAATNPTGNVNVTVSGLLTGTGQNGPTTVTVAGGASVVVNTTGGSVIAGTKATPITGPVTITDTQVGPSADAITVFGGSSTTGNSVSITTTATAGNITVGPAGLAALNAAGTALKTPSDYANGTISIVDESLAGSNAAGATNVFGTGAISVNTNGATAVSVAGGINVTVVDEQTTPATGGASAGSAIGTSTLTTVTLDGVGGGVSTLTSGVLANLTVLDSAKASPIAGSTNVTVVSPAALALTLGNDGAGTTIIDDKTTSITVTTSGTASDSFILSAKAATALTFNNTAAVTLAAGAASNDALVKTITLTGSGAVTLPDFSGAATTADPALTSIAGGTATGAITVGGLDVFKTAFAGGSANDSVTIIDNPNPPAGNTVQTISGGGGTNTIVANYIAKLDDVALHSVNQISGFTVFGLGKLADSTVGPFNKGALVNPYDAGGFSSLTVGQTANSVTFSDIGGGTTNLAITASQGALNTPGGAIDYLLNDPGKNADTLAITVGSDTSTLAQATAITSIVNLAPDTITGGKGDAGTVNTISIASLDPATFIGTNNITINDAIPNLNGPPAAGTAVLAISGDFAAKVAYNPGAGLTSTLSLIASTDTAPVDVTGVNEAAAGVTITGGAGKITAFGASELTGALPPNTAAVDLFTTGAGGGVYAIGAGGGWNPTLNKGAGGNDSGSETVNLSASTAVSDTVKVGPSVSSINNGSGAGGITGFQAVATQKTADVIQLTGAITGAPANSGYSVMSNAAANASSKIGLQNVDAFVNNLSPALEVELTNYGKATGGGTASFTNLTFSSSNGVITFGAVSGHNINEFNPTLLLGAAEAIASAEAVATGQDQVAVFSAAFAGLSSNTFVVASDMFNNAIPLVKGANVNGAFLNGADTGHMFGASAVELNGVTGITGFGATAAANLIELSGGAQALPVAIGGVFKTLANGGVGNVGDAATGKAFDDTGFSEDTLGAGAAATITNTYNNLGSFAQIDVTGGGQQGSLTIGAQVGTAGSDSFLLNFASAGGAAAVSTLTVTSDDLVTIATGPAVTDTIATFTDAGNSVTSLVATGTGNLTITNPISDATLTSIDAHGLTGALTINVTEQVTINGALGGDTIVASGAGDVITIGSTTNAITGPISITANASGDTITLTHEGPGGAIVSAASGGDTITVDLGINALAGTFTGLTPTPPAVTSLGAGDTINLHSGVETFVAAGAPLQVNGTVADFAWVGSGTTVHLGTTANPWGGTSAVASAQDNATILVVGDTTGATSGNSPAITVISGFLDNSASGAGNYHLTIDFSDVGGALISVPSSPAWTWAGAGTAAGAQVNMAGATSLANALDTAAGATVIFDAKAAVGAHTTVLNGQILEGTVAAPKVGLLDWFQFQGNTYVVETLNTGTAPAAHSALGTSDVVVELTGLVNVTADVAAGHLVFGH